MSAQRLVRLKAEMAMMAKNPIPGIHCWLKESDSDVIIVEMDGPEGSPYQNGVFQLEVVLSERYPFTPPNVRFITPVYHPNIDPNGRICMTALKPKPTGTWAVNLNIATVLGAIRILLSEPNLSDPLMAEIAKQYTENYMAFRETAEAETLKHAKKNSSTANQSEKIPIAVVGAASKRNVGDTKENNVSFSKGKKQPNDDKQDFNESLPKKPRFE